MFLVGGVLFVFWMADCQAVLGGTCHLYAYEEGETESAACFLIEPRAIDFVRGSLARCTHVFARESYQGYLRVKCPSGDRPGAPAPGFP